MGTTTAWAFEYFIGIDVSKASLDFTIMKRNTFVNHYKIGNSETEIMSLILKIKADDGIKISKTIFGLEQTGFYCNHLIACLLKTTEHFVLEDPGHLRNSLGTIRGKNDKIDSERIARYLIKNRDSLRLFKPKRPILDELSKLASLRERMVSVYKALRTPLKEEKGFLKKTVVDEHVRLCESSLMSVKRETVQLEKHIERLWKTDPRLNHLMTLMLSIPGVGPITALQVLISTNEFLGINDSRKFACYCGVAPFEHSSGTSVRKKTRISKISNRKLKSLLHSCALSARRYVPEIKSYYERKLVEGKHRMSVMNAIRFKIIARIFACVKQERLYQEVYSRVYDKI